jgi:hypothetical protein
MSINDQILRWVQTEMGNFGAVTFGLEKAALELETSVNGMVKVVR